MAKLIDLLAKGFLAAAVAILGAVAAITQQSPPAMQVEALPPVESVSRYSSETVLSQEATIQAEHLNRLELELKEQQERATRINGKLDRLLEPGEGKVAGAKQR